jgi:alpha-tubulin suppressor-like RCC1 family protein
MALALTVGTEAATATPPQPVPQLISAWGANQLGQLGDGTTANSNTPVEVRGVNGTGTLGGVTAVSAGGDHTLALLSNGTVVAWGANNDGQLGDGMMSGDSETPVQVVGPGGIGTLTGVTAIAANDDYSLALLSNGTVMSWGSGGFGQLGDDATANSDAPVPVSGIGGAGELTDVSAVAAGQDHGLALLGDGTAVAWGSDTDGQLGDGSMDAGSTTPVQVVARGGSGTLGGVSALAAGQDHSLALLANGTVLAWGSNNAGQLGDGSTTSSDAPVQVNGLGGSGALTGVTQLAAGQDHNLALLADGTVVAWGSNSSGQLGTNGFPFPPFTNNESPGQVAGPGGGQLNGVAAIAAGASHSLALLASGTVVAWGSNSGGQLGEGSGFFGFQSGQVVGPGGYGTLSDVTAIASGSSASQSFALQPEPGQPSSSTQTLTIGDKRLTLTTPPAGACVVPFGTVQLALAANTLRSGAKAVFNRAALYLGKGIERRQTALRHHKKVIVTTFVPNLTITHLPASRQLATQVSSGAHVLTVKVTLTELLTRHHRRVKKSVTRTLRYQFSIC